MTFPAAHGDALHVVRFQTYLFWNLASQMEYQALNVFQMKTCIERELIAMTVGTRQVTMRRSVPIGVGLPDFMAARARPPT